MTDMVAAITELRRNYKLTALLELAGIPRNTYYHCKKAQSGNKYNLEKTEITAIYKENQGRYGYRQILTLVSKKSTTSKVVDELRSTGIDNK